MRDYIYIARHDSGTKPVDEKEAFELMAGSLKDVEIHVYQKSHVIGKIENPKYKDK